MLSKFQALEKDKFHDILNTKVVRHGQGHIAGRGENFNIRRMFSKCFFPYCVVNGQPFLRRQNDTGIGLDKIESICRRQIKYIENGKIFL